MKHVRNGKYTKQPTRFTRAKAWTRRRWLWFKGLSKPKKVLIISAPILAVLIIIPIVTYMYYAHDISDQERLMNRNNTGVVLLDNDGEAFYSVGRAEHRNLVPLDEISDDMKNALIASEDKNFYEHSGFSVAGYARALFTGVGGGSTITMQLAKNTLLSSKQTYLRKYQELFISIAIERQYTKDEILEMYLNSVFYGENTFGIEEAARVYFDTTPAKLTLAQSSMLVGLLPAPSAYSPISGDAEYAKERQSIVLGLMVDQGYITEEQKTAAENEKLVYSGRATEAGIAPHFAEMVIQELSDEYGYEAVMRSGYQVTTTLDTKAQKSLNANLQANMSYIRANSGSNASGVAIDPKTGHILALVGSADYSNDEWGNVNMVTTARQPGSTFKSIYYAGALAEGVITPATVLHDEAINLDGWQPQNADRKFRGDVTVRSAINQSLNIPSIEVMQKYGIDESIAQAQSLGITALDPDRDYGLPLAIGSGEVPLLQMTNAYAAFANQGQVFETTAIQSISDKFNKTIYKEPTPQSTQGISQAGAFLISDILSDNAARAPIFGSSLTVSGHTAAVKTGTTDENRDAWTIGYTPSLAIGVWVGNNDNSIMYNGGSGMAGPIWRGTMSDMLDGQDDEQFAKPNSVVERSTCYSNYGLATNAVTNGTFDEYYLSSALPTTTCTPEEPKISVCDLSTGEVVSILEADYDNKKYSKNTKKCEPPTQEVCDLSTGEIITIDTDEFDEDKYSTDTENCGDLTVSMVEACNTTTGEVVTIEESLLDGVQHTTNTSDCQIIPTP